MSVSPELLKKLGVAVSEYCQETAQQWRVEIHPNNQFNDFEGFLLHSYTNEKKAVVQGNTRDEVAQKMIDYLNNIVVV